MISGDKYKKYIAVEMLFKIWRRKLPNW